MVRVYSEVTKRDSSLFARMPGLVFAIGAQSAFVGNP